ncbi:MAG: ATP-binding protein [Thermomicrobiales bacterium]
MTEPNRAAGASIRPDDAEGDGAIPAAAPGIDLLTMADAARIKGVSYHTVSRAVRRGRLPVQRLGRMALIAAADLEAWQPMTERRPRRYRQDDETAGTHTFVQDGGDAIGRSQLHARIVGELQADALSLDLPAYLTRCAERMARAFACSQVSIWSWGDAPSAGMLSLASRFRRGPISLDGQPGGPAGAPAIDLQREPGLRTLLMSPQPRVVPVPFAAAALLGFREREPLVLIAPIQTMRGPLGVVVASPNGRSLGDVERYAIEQFLDQVAFGWAMQRDRIVGEERIRLLEAAINAAPIGLRVVDGSGWAFRNRADLAFFPAGSDAAALVDANAARTPLDGSHGELIVQDDVGRRLNVETSPLVLPGVTPADRAATVVVSHDVSETVARHEDAEHTIRILRRDVKTAQAMSDLMRHVQGVATAVDVLRRGAGPLIESVGGNGAVVELRDWNGTFQRVSFGDGEADPERTLHYSPMSYPTMVLAFARRHPVVLTRHVAATFEREALERMGWHSMLMVPLIADDEQLGFVMIGYAGGTVPGFEIVTLAGDLAGVLAEAIVASRTMERLDGELRRFTTVLDQVPQAVVIVRGNEGAIEFANPAADRLWGWDAGQRPRSVMELPVLDAEGFPVARDLHPLMLSLRTGRAYLGEPLTIRTVAGKAIDVLGTIAPVLAPDSTIGGSVILLQDRSQFRRLEEAKEAFVAMVAHELRNPLTAVVGNMQLLERQIARHPERIDPELQERLRVLSRQVDLMSGLVARLLDRSRLEFGQLDIAPVASDAVAIVQQASDDVSVLMEGGMVSVSAPAHIPVCWDEVRMRQVMTNLLSNAIRHGEGRVEVSIGFLPAIPDCPLGTPDRVRIGVRDHGPGIDAVAKARLFTPHARLAKGPSSQVTPEHGGLGIGLYLSERIVAAHGGTTMIDNADGGGALVVIEIPAIAKPGRVTAIEGILHYDDA